MGRCRPMRTHLVENDIDAGFCRLKCRFATRQAATHDRNRLHTYIVWSDIFP